MSVLIFFPPNFSFPSLRTFLYMSAAELQLVYTPPLYSSPQHAPQLQPSADDPLPTLITGHSLEANFSNNFTVFIGQDQVTHILTIYQVCMCVFMYACVHVCVCVFVHVCMCVFTCMYVCIDIQYCENSRGKLTQQWRQSPELFSPPHPESCPLTRHPLGPESCCPPSPS